MSEWSVPSRHTTDSNCATFAPFVLSLAVVLSVACWQPCEAQQIPRRLDTSNYQNRGPTSPKTELPGPLTIERVRSPDTGKTIKIYQKPAQARPPQQLELFPHLKEPPKPVASKRRDQSPNEEIRYLTRRVEELKRELSDLSRRLDELKKKEW